VPSAPHEWHRPHDIAAQLPCVAKQVGSAPEESISDAYRDSFHSSQRKNFVLSRICASVEA
jgi:hypothetical protein